MEKMQIVAAKSFKDVEAQYVELMVPLNSYGLALNVGYTQQKVTVWGIYNKYDVLDMMRSKRKEARFWNTEDNVVFPRDRESTSNKHAASLGRSLSWNAWKKLVFARSNSF